MSKEKQQSDTREAIETLDTQRETNMSRSIVTAEYENNPNRRDEDKWMAYDSGPELMFSNTERPYATFHGLSHNLDDIKKDIESWHQKNKKLLIVDWYGQAHIKKDLNPDEKFDLEGIGISLSDMTWNNRTIEEEKLLTPTNVYDEKDLTEAFKKIDDKIIKENRLLTHVFMRPWAGVAGKWNNLDTLFNIYDNIIRGTYIRMAPDSYFYIELSNLDHADLLIRAFEDVKGASIEKKYVTDKNTGEKKGYQVYMIHKEETGYPENLPSISELKSFTNLKALVESVNKFKVK